MSIEIALPIVIALVIIAFGIGFIFGVLSNLR